MCTFVCSPVIPLMQAQISNNLWEGLSREILMGPCAHGGEHEATVIKSNGKMLFGCVAFSADIAPNSDKPYCGVHGYLILIFQLGSSP